MDYILLIAGLCLLLLGANVLVDSSVAIAKKAHLSNFIIGFTIIGMGTSSPELFISISSAINGSGDMALGNVIGSNICNTLLILGATATILPFAIERQQTRRDIPFAIVASIIMALLACDRLIFNSENTISRIDGIVLLGLFVAYTAYVLIKSKGSNEETGAEEPTRYDKINVFLLIVIALAALTALLMGGNMFLDSAKSLARTWGMSESVISITIVAVGTSLPELITCVVAALRGNAQLALGNVLGSNIFNILMILGIAATIKPLCIENIMPADIMMLIASAVLCYIVVFTFGKHRFDRIEGIIFFLLFVAYNVSLLLR